MGCGHSSLKVYDVSYHIEAEPSPQLTILASSSKRGRQSADQALSETHVACEDVPVPSLEGTWLTNAVFVEKRLGEGGHGLVYSATCLAGAITDPGSSSTFCGDEGLNSTTIAVTDGLDLECDEKKEIDTRMLFHTKPGKSGKDAQFRCALKHVKVGEKQDKHTVFLLNEEHLLSKFNFPFIPKLYGSFEVKGTRFMMMELATGGDLHSYLRRQPGGKISDGVARYYLGCAILGMGYMHLKGYIHGDVKPKNILIGEQGKGMLCDFGLSLQWEVLKSPKARKKYPWMFGGTKSYMAPEKFYRCHVSPVSDFYSLGVLLFRMLTGSLPYDVHDFTTQEWLGKCLDYTKMIGGHAPRDEVREELRVRQRAFAPPNIPLYAPWGLPSNARSLIEGLLICDPKYRLGIGGIVEILRHPFFNNFDWIALRENKLKLPSR